MIPPVLSRLPPWSAITALAVSLVATAGASPSCAGHEAEEGRLSFTSNRSADDEARAAADQQTGVGSFFPVEPPPFSEGIFPCMECHADQDTDPTPRELDEHDQIKLKHGDRSRWCFDCHDPDDRNMLRLANGTKVPFTESFRLCGQCHGDKFKDWRKGTHGKRKGEWGGDKMYYLCAACHDPHAPAFKPIAPEPQPIRPGATTRRFP